MGIVTAILLGVSCLLWLGLVINALTIHSSDPAGRGLAVAYGAANAGLLLLAMGAMFIACAIGKQVPPWLLLSSIVLMPAACAAGLGTLTLLGRYPRMRWVVASPVLGPGLLLALAAWCRWWRMAGTDASASELTAISLAAASCLLPWLGWWLAPRLQRRMTRPRPPGKEETSACEVDQA